MVKILVVIVCIISFTYIAAVVIVSYTSKNGRNTKLKTVSKFKINRLIETEHSIEIDKKEE